MKKKCQKCGGRGGATRSVVGKLSLKEYFVPCVECMGKGVWWDKKHKKDRPVAADHRRR